MLVNEEGTHSTVSPEIEVRFFGIGGEGVIRLLHQVFGIGDGECFSVSAMFIFGARTEASTEIEVRFFGIGGGGVYTVDFYFYVLE